MKNQTAVRIRRIYGILLSLSIVVAGLCLIGACLAIYDSGNGEYSPEAVAAAFSPISVPVYLCLVLVLAGFPLSWLLPAEKSKPKAGRQNAAILRRLHGKVSLEDCPAELRQAVAAQQTGRRLRSGVTLALSAGTFLIFMLYVLTGDRFLLPDITASMIRAMALLLPCLLITFGWALFTHYRNESSILLELELMKQAAKEAPSQASGAQPETSMNGDLLRYGLLLLAVTVLLFGYFTGGTADVLTKAINICTECVGLG